MIAHAIFGLRRTGLDRILHTAAEQVLPKEFGEGFLAMVEIRWRIDEDHGLRGKGPQESGQVVRVRCGELRVCSDHQRVLRGGTAQQIDSRWECAGLRARYHK